MDERILMIETSTECCSAALCEGTRILARRMTETPRQHASMLGPFIAEILRERGLKAAQLDAVAVSEGPGSYTGLRVGVSTAKGICFGGGIPLIGVDTLEILAWQAEEGFDSIVPMIDARRMEVYCATFDGVRRRQGPTEALVLDRGSFSGPLDRGRVLFIGDGVAKFEAVCRHPNASFKTCSPIAEAMLQPALSALRKKEFEDTAYFEPFYLKEFVAGISKKSVL